MEKQPPRWALAIIESMGFEGDHAIELAHRLAANEEIDYAEERRKASDEKLVKAGLIDRRKLADYRANSRVLTGEEAARAVRRMNEREPVRTMTIAYTTDDRVAWVSSQIERPVRRLSLPRPGRRTARRVSVARRSRRTAARGTPSRPGDEPPRLTRLLLWIIGSWLGLNAWERAIDDVWADLRRQLRGGVK